MYQMTSNNQIVLTYCLPIQIDLVTDGLQQIPFACTIIVMTVTQVSDVKVSVNSIFTYSCLHYWYDLIAWFWNMGVHYLFDNSSVGID